MTATFRLLQFRVLDAASGAAAFHTTAVAPAVTTRSTSVGGHACLRIGGRRCGGLFNSGPRGGEERGWGARVSGLPGLPGLSVRRVEQFCRSVRLNFFLSLPSPIPHSPIPAVGGHGSRALHGLHAAGRSLGLAPPLSIGGTNAGCSRPAGLVSDHGKAGAPPIFATRRISNFALITDHRPGTHSRVMQISQTRHVRPVGRAPPIEVASSPVKAVPQCIGLYCVSLVLSLLPPVPDPFILMAALPPRIIFPNKVTLPSIIYTLPPPLTPTRSPDAQTFPLLVHDPSSNPLSRRPAQ